MDRIATIEFLVKYVGQEIIRIGPTTTSNINNFAKRTILQKIFKKVSNKPNKIIEDFSYTNEIVTLLGFADGDRMIIKHKNAKIELLKINFTDDLWYPKTILKGNCDPELNKLIGSYIELSEPVFFVKNECDCDSLFIYKSLLKDVGKYHMTVETWCGEERILDFRYLKYPAIWKKS